MKQPQEDTSEHAMSHHPSAENAATSEAIFPATSMPDADWWRALWPDPDAVVRTLGVGAGMRVLDLACGDGYFTAALARCVGPGQVLGLDLDAGLLAAAQAACAGLPCQWRLADAMAIDRLGLGSFDVVLMANTFHGVPDKETLARVVAAVLAPTGRFVIVNWHPAPREQTPVLGQPRGPRTDLRLSPEATAQIVRPAGLEPDRLIPLPPYHYGLVLHKPSARDPRAE